MTTADFAEYKAIIMPDPNCGRIERINFFDKTKDVWGPAVLGNIILIGTDPDFHSSSRPGATTLIDDGVRFAASGNGTGLYFALSCYYDSISSSTVNALSYFGRITVRGRLACYNRAHLVANSSALRKLNDAALSDWSCSVHEVFTSYPTTGLYGFEPLAIAEGATGPGQQSYGDNTTGIPYIIVKGATPAGCGNGIYEPKFGEECDDGPLNGTPDSACSTSCKCLNGAVVPGTCHSPGPNSTFTTTLFTPSISSSSAFFPPSSFASASSRFASLVPVLGAILIITALADQQPHHFIQIQGIYPTELICIAINELILMIFGLSSLTTGISSPASTISRYCYPC